MAVTDPTKSKRSGSDTRRRWNRYTARFDDAEDAKLQARALARNLSVSAYIRACALGDPGPRSRHLPPRKTPELAHAMSAVNKAGGNLKQLIVIFETAGADITSQQCRAALAELQAGASAIVAIGTERRGSTENAVRVASATVTLNEAGRELNQVLRILNAGAAGVTTQQARTAIAEVHTAAMAMRQIVRPPENPR